MYNPDISESLTDRALYYNFSDAAQVRLNRLSVYY